MNRNERAGKARIAADNKSISYRLTFSGLSSRVTAAHIHGARGTNGPVVVFFCGGGGDTYVNVHSTKYKDGEIRGQIAIGM